ncbi:odorant receptor Or1-like [Diabrotica virgifera virgifera]|uniref:Odorant receptor n=1 Tax=Diabrotica virgifera virgifera TaxID=50390 RepID=A0ABM5JR32_DIAVI|nr:odorant receptor Or1-like [Diabrotica virgifera virgifera]
MLFDNIAYRVLGTRDYAKLFLWVPKILFQMVQKWPGTEHFRIKAFISSLLCGSLMAFIAVGLYNDMEFDINAIDKNMYNLALIISTFQASYKTIVMWYKASELKELLDDIITKFWPYNLAGEDLSKRLKTFYFIIMIVMLSLLSAAFLFGIVFLVVPLFAEKRQLPFPAKYSFDWSPSPIYQLVYLSHTIGFLVVMVSCILGVDCMFLGIGASAVTQYRILQRAFAYYNAPEMREVGQKLKELDREGYASVYDDKAEYFTRCLNHHLLLLKYDEFTADKLILAAVLALGYLDQLMVYCIIGNELNYQASLLPEYIYKSNWGELENRSLQRDVIFLIQHSQRVPQLSAYGLYDINMNSFVKVLKLAFSFYTLLSNISN